MHYLALGCVTPGSNPGNWRLIRYKGIVDDLVAGKKLTSHQLSQPGQALGEVHVVTNERGHLCPEGRVAVTEGILSLCMGNGWEGYHVKTRTNQT